MSSLERFVREIDATRRLALGHATTPQLGASTIGQNGLEFVDNDGNVVGIIGSGDDGGLAISHPSGPKPPKPDKPVVTADAGLMRVEWSGSFESLGDTATMKTSDLDRVEIHASMDENFVPDRVVSFGGAYATLDGGSHTLGPLGEAGTWYVRLVARSKAHKYSEPSDLVSVEMARGSIDEALTDAWLTGSAAAITADGKNGIWRGPDEPVADPTAPFRDGDIWFEMTEDGKSIPNIWDEELGEWVGNDDYRQSEIEKVQDELREDLDAIVTDGSGTKNFYRGTMPTDAESSEGDLWFDSSDNNLPYIYQDGAWVTVQSSFDTPGAGESLSDLSDGSALEKVVTSDAEFANDESRNGRWTYGGTTSAGDMTFAIPAVGGVDASTFNMTFDGTEATKVGLGLVADAALYINSPGGAPIVQGIFFVGGGILTEPAAVSYSLPVEAGSGGLSGATHHLEGISGTSESLLSGYLADGLIDQLAFGIRVTLPYAPGAWVEMSVLSVTQAVTSNGITSEAVTTDKIAVGAITAESGIIGSINAGTITVGEMNGARIKAQTIDADTVLIGSSIGSTLIKDGAILTDHIKAGAITADSGIIGSIDANVITVGKIMANQLDADAINGKTITGAKIRTASSGSRVELTQNGLKQYNSLGGTVVDMTAGSIELAGDLTVSSNALVTGSLNVKGGTDVSQGLVEMSFARDWQNRPGVIFTGADEYGRLEWDLPAYMSAERVNASNSSRLLIAGPQIDSQGENQGLITLQPREWFIGLGGTSGPIPSMRENYISGRVSTSSASVASVTMHGAGGGITATATSASQGFQGRIQSRTIYGTTGISSRSVYVQSNGYLGVQSSSLRYKRDVESAPPIPTVLDIEPKYWRYISEVEEYEEAQAYIERIGEGPLPIELAANPTEPLLKYGAIAEEVHDLGVTDLVQYDEFGRPDGLAYEKFGLALVPIVRDLRDRITELEAQLAS